MNKLYYVVDYSSCYGVFLKGNRENTSKQCFPKTEAKNSKFDAPAITPHQPVDAA
jgi:hypothetical protein